MAESATCSLFLEDEVCKQTESASYTFGLVLENSEYASSDEEEEEDYKSRLKPGTVKIAWHPEGEETVEEENKVILTDRSFESGDVVRRLIKGEKSPKGFVQDATVKCHIHIKGTEKFIFNVDSKDLSPLQGFELDQGEVTMDSWVGRLKAINQKIRVIFPDGAKCEMMDSDLSMLESDLDVAQDSEYSSDGCFYKGQVFTGVLGDFQDVDWLTQTKMHNARRVKKHTKQPICVQVEEMFVNSLEIHWICRGFAKVEDSVKVMDHPPSEIPRKDIHKVSWLSYFKHCSVQIGDKYNYVIKEKDILTETPPKGHIIPDIVALNSSSDIDQPLQTSTHGNREVDKLVLASFQRNNDARKTSPHSTSNVDQPFQTSPQSTSNVDQPVQTSPQSTSNVDQPVQISSHGTSNVDELAQISSGTSNVDELAQISSHGTSNVDELAQISSHCTSNVDGLAQIYSGTSNVDELAQISSHGTSNVDELAQISSGTSNVDELAQISSHGTSNVDELAQISSGTSNVDELAQISSHGTRNVDELARTSPQHSTRDNGFSENAQQKTSGYSNETDSGSDKVTRTDTGNSCFHAVEDSDMEVDQNAECNFSDSGSLNNTENCGDEERDCDSDKSYDEEEEETTKVKPKQVSNSQPRKKARSKKHGSAKKNVSKNIKSLTKFNTNLVDVNPGSEVAVEVCYTFSLLNIMWQNGQEEIGVPSPELFPVYHLDELEFFPGDFVVESKDTYDDDRDYGVVVSCDHIARTCLVKWMKIVDITKGEKPETDASPTEVSVYDIMDHPDFQFRTGHTVIRVSEPANVTENTPAVGQICKMEPQGTVCVRWATGEITHCYPQELYIVGEEMSEFDSDSDSDWESVDDKDDENSDASWETEEEIEGFDTAASTPALTPSDTNKKELLEGVFETAQKALIKLEDIFTDEECVIYNPEQRFVAILAMNRKCKELEKFLRTTCIEDSTLTTHIDKLKAKLRQVKANRINKHLLQVFETRKHQGHGEERDDSVVVDKDESNKENPNDEVGMKIDNVGTECNTTISKLSMNGCNNVQVSETPQPLTSHSSDDLPSGGQNVCTDATAVQQDPCEKSQQQDVSSSACCSEEDKDCHMDKENIELCSKICKLLRHKITKIQEEIIGKCNILAQSPSGISAKDASETMTDSKSKENMDIEAFKMNLEQSVAQILEEETTGREMEVESVASPRLSKEECQPAEETSPKSETKDTTQLDKEDDVQHIEESFRGGLCLEEAVSPKHTFYSKESQGHSKSFMSTVIKEIKLLHTSLPKGILVKTFEDRMELFSVMILGPARTPYEDAPFFFDVYLPAEYPTVPPQFHYISFCVDRLNPNLYQDGNVCVSLLGTWDGKEKENWTSNSNLLQVFVSVQGLILVAEPYYNEAGYEKQKGSQQGHENSKSYNEMAVLKLVQSLSRMIKNPPHSFEQELKDHLIQHGERFCRRIEFWVSLSERDVNDSQTKSGNATESLVNGEDSVGTGSDITTSAGRKEIQEIRSDKDTVQQTSIEKCDPTKEEFSKPDFPLLPGSRGFCLTMRKHLKELKESLKELSS